MRPFVHNQNLCLDIVKSIAVFVRFCVWASCCDASSSGMPCWPPRIALKQDSAVNILAWCPVQRYLLAYGCSGGYVCSGGGII